MDTISKITDAEYKVMQVVWQQKEATSAQIIQALEGTESWDPKTIYTLISRLVNKGALKILRTQGRTHYYGAVVTQEDYRRHVSSSLLERLYGNSLKNLVACFLKEQPLSREELSQLRQLLEEEESQVGDN